MEASKVWAAALGELSLQMTKATYKTWVRPTEALRWEGDCLVVGVANEFTRDWLENRLLGVIERTLIGIVGRPVSVRFLVTERLVIIEGPVPKVEDLKAGDVAFKFYRFDLKKAGFLQIPKYHIYFWQPFLDKVALGGRGRIPAWGTYVFLRAREMLNEGWGAWNKVSVGLIAVTVGVGRQAITGVQRRRKSGERYWQRGAFCRLEEAGLVQVERLGKGKKTSYRILCLHDLPLLVPEQVETLPEILQLEHADFLRRCSIEYEEWKQLEMETLVRE